MRKNAACARGRVLTMLVLLSAVGALAACAKGEAPGGSVAPPATVEPAKEGAPAAVPEKEAAAGRPQAAGQPEEAKAADVVSAAGRPDATGAPDGALKPDGGGAAAPGLVCLVSEVNLADLTGESVLGQDKVKDALLDGLREAGPKGVEAGTGGGLKLYVEYAVRASAEGEEKMVFFGARGFLKGATVPVATVLEAVVQKDVPLPAECAGGLGAGECPTQLMTRCVRPAMAQLAARAYLLCRLQGAAEAEVGAQLESPDAWARGEAAKVAGERGLKGLIPLLLKHMGEEDLLVAYPCIGALGRLGSDAQVAELVKRAERAPEFLVQAVAVALKDINTPLSRQYLESWAKSHPAESVRELAGKLLSSGSDAGGAVPPAK